LKCKTEQQSAGHLGHAEASEHYSGEVRPGDVSGAPARVELDITIAMGRPCGNSRTGCTPRSMLTGPSQVPIGAVG
jgi:hypothetical protein